MTASGTGPDGTGTAAPTGDRCATLRLDGGRVLLYDRELEGAWIETTVAVPPEWVR